MSSSAVEVSAPGERERPVGRARARALGMAAVFVVVVGLTVALFRDTGALLNHYDDAYITYRYAIHLAEGHGLVFNLGERTDAASSFLYALLLSAVHRAGFHDLERASLAIGLASAGGAAAAVYSGVLHLSGRALLAAALGVAAGAHGLMSGWAVSGMETSFYALLVTLFFERCFVRGREDLRSALLLALVALARVEGLLVVGAWALGRGRALFSGPDAGDPAARRRALLHGAIVGFAILAFFSFKLAYYGTLLPHTFHLKQLVLLYRASPEALWRTWSVGAPAILALGAAGLASLPPSSNRLGAAALLALGAGSCAVGPWADWARYSVYLLPPFVLLAGVPLGLLLDARKLRLTGALLLLLVGRDVIQSYGWLHEFMASFSDHQRCRKEVGEHLRRSFDSSQVVLSSDIGAIAYRAMDFAFVDMVGLTSSDIMKRYQERRSVDDVLSRRSPSLAADTWKRFGGGWFYSAEALVMWPEMILLHRIEPSSHNQGLQSGAPVFTCVARDGTRFAVGPLSPL